MAILNIDAQQLKVLIDSNDACLVDVREAIEHDAFHIAPSAHIPLGKITSDLLPKTDKKVVIYCLKGVRGQKACEKVTATNDDVDVFNLTGGINAWRAAGLPLKVSEKKHFPLDRQVQITIGSFVLFSALASVLVNPAFVWVAAFFGAGLMFAGMTGTCGLGLLIAKMPWNKAT
ncbi:MAG: rhodanese-like domain-containing protein [Pseudomonadota bacterium]